MNLTLSEQQQFILDAVNKLLEKNGGYQRAMDLLPQAAYDAPLEAELDAAGFGNVALERGTGPLEAALIAHEICCSGGTVSFAARSLVAPMVLGELPDGPVSLARGSAAVPLRFGPHARTVLVDAGEQALQLAVTPEDWEAVDNDRAGYPLARLTSSALGRARGLGAGTGETLRRWWRVGLAIETAGTMKGAFDTTVAYVKERIQFNRPIGSFQAVQHRLAELAVLVEGARWLALEAAYAGAPALGAATAAGHAAGAAGKVFRECHQLHGAMGFTREHRLHVWSMRLRALELELGGVTAHRREVGREKYAASAGR
jgi:hypothetical protein